MRINTILQYNATFVRKYMYCESKLTVENKIWYRHIIICILAQQKQSLYIIGDNGISGTRQHSN